MHPDFPTIRRPGFELLPVAQCYRNARLYSDSDIQWKSDPFEIILPGSHTRYHTTDHFKEIQIEELNADGLCFLNLSTKIYRITLKFNVHDSKWDTEKYTILIDLLRGFQELNVAVDLWIKAEKFASKGKVIFPNGRSGNQTPPHTPTSHQEVMSNPEILELLPTDDEPALLESVSTLRNPDMTKTRVKKRTEENSGITILRYSEGLIGSVDISQDDLERLKPKAWLNDNILEFGLRFFLRELEINKPHIRSQIHVFTSFFYKKLSGPNPQLSFETGLKKWTSRCDIFKKKYIIVPINDSLHWFLAIIYQPECTLSPPNNSEGMDIDSPRTYIFTLDSLGGRHDNVNKLLTSYLKMEAKDKKSISTFSDPVNKFAPVSIQPNGWDCGVYLLHFFRMFIDDPEKHMKIIIESNFGSKNEKRKLYNVHPSDISSLRQELLRTMDDLVTHKNN